MDICEKYLQDARKALKGSMFSKPNPVEAVRSYEGAAQCFENYQEYERAAQCYVDTADLVMNLDPLKAAEMLEKAAGCAAKLGGSSEEFYLQAAGIFKEHAVKSYKQNPDQALQLLQKAAESFEKGGRSDMAVQCYEVGAEASLKRDDYLNAIVFYGTAGQHFERRKDYKKAVKYFHEVAKLWNEQKVPGNVAENYLRMAGCLKAMEEHMYASQFYVKAAQKYEQAGEIYKSAKAYEKASDTLESQEEFMKAAEYYKKSAELIKSLKNLDKFAELYDKAAECFSKGGDINQSVNTRLALAETFSDDPYRCSTHFEKAIASAKDDISMKITLLEKQGDVLLDMHDHLKAARSFQEAGGLLEERGENAVDVYRKAGDAYVLYAKAMQKVKNPSMAKQGHEQAVICFEKANLPEEAEKVRQVVKPDTGERQAQITEELSRLKNDFENGLIPPLYYQQIKDGYQELLKNLKK